MYEEEPWVEEQQQPQSSASRVTPDPKRVAAPMLADVRPSLVRTLSQKFVPGLMLKETTGRERLTRAMLNGDYDAAAICKACVFDPAVWSDAFRSAATVGTKAARARLRLLVLEGTRQAALEEQYWLLNRGGDAKRVALPTHAHTLEAVTMFDYTNDTEPARALREARYSGTAHFIYADVVDVGVFMKQEQKCNPLVLVFAHPTALGGSPDGGGSQEEAVLRRTNLSHIVNNDGRKNIRRDWRYALPRHGGLYVADATVLRSNESTGYKFLQAPLRMAFVLAAAPLNLPRDVPNLGAKFVADWRRRIDAVLAVALQKGHDVVVLGAWGCGELGNDPRQVAELFHDAVSQRFRGCFKHVVFAFLHDPVAFRAFCEVFGSPRMPVPAEDAADLRQRRGQTTPAAAANKRADKQASRKGKGSVRVTPDPRHPNIDPDHFTTVAATAPAPHDAPPVRLAALAASTITTRVTGDFGGAEEATSEEEVLDWGTE